MRKAIGVIICVIAVLCVGCTKNEKSELLKGESLRHGDFDIRVISGYMAVPSIDVDVENRLFTIKVEMTNDSHERRDVAPDGIFSLVDMQGESFAYEKPAFNAISGYIEKGEKKQGQISFKVPNDYMGELRLEVGERFVRFNIGKDEILNSMPLAEYGLNDEVKIDQIIVKVTKVSEVEYPHASKMRYKADISLKSVSAGAPSNISGDNFRFYGKNNARLGIVENTLTTSLPTNESASGYIIFECDKGTTTNDIVLGVSRHITGQDLQGISLADKIDVKQFIESQK